MKNPYSWTSVNPALCYGRDKMRINMFTGLAYPERGSFGLAGGRRIGKSTLLRRIEQDIKDDAARLRSGGLVVLPIYIDGLALPEPLSATYLWSTLLKRMHLGLINVDYNETTDVDFDFFKYQSSKLFEKVMIRTRIVVIFDEIEPIVQHSWAHGFLSNWRSLLSNTREQGLQEYFTAVFAGGKELAALQRDLGSPLRNILANWYSAQVLDVESAYKLMQDPVGVQWPEPFMQKVYIETGGHPMLVQYIMHKVCNNSIDKALMSLAGAIEEFEQDQEWYFKEWWERYCDASARQIYASLPDDGSALPRRALTLDFGTTNTELGLQILQFVGIATGDRVSQTYRYTGEMFRRWYKRNIAGTHDVSYKRELFTSLLKIDNHAADKYSAGWKAYQSAGWKAYQDGAKDYLYAIDQMRDALVLVLDRLAPRGNVIAQLGFAFEMHQTEPTLHQRIIYAARNKSSGAGTAAQIGDEYRWLEMQIDDFIRFYNRSSINATHAADVREMAYKVMHLWDQVLGQLS